MFWIKKKKNKGIILMCNSWPKSGTHLLLNMSTTILNNSGEWFNEPAIKSPPDNIDLLFTKINDRITIYKENFAMKGHIGYSGQIEEYFNNNNIKMLFIVRDPRDVICSTIRWVLDLRKNWDANNFFKDLSKEDQLSYAIKGMPNVSPFNNKDSFVLWEKSIVDRYKLITPWANSESACLLKYEELSGNLGNELYNSSINKIINFLSIEENTIGDNLKNNLIEKNSSTFHSGNSGRWRNEFTNKNIEEFINVRGEELINQFNYNPTV